MKREDAEMLYDIYQRALKVLSEAEAVVWKLPEGEERNNYVRAHTNVITVIVTELRAPLVRQYHELDTEVLGPPDTLLDAKEQEIVDSLTAAQVQRIDDALLADCAPSWRKVARVVLTATMRLKKELPGVPAGYYVLRVASLVHQGRLESEGNLDYMGYSEVRLCQGAERDT